MNAKLIIVGGKANRSEIALRLPTVIGRSREADLTMAHPMVSRRHCELFQEGGLLKIRDLGSLNGTFVGEEQVREAELYPSTEFTVGPLTFRVEYEYVAGIAPPPAADAADDPPGLVEPDPPIASGSETERQTVQNGPDFVDVQQRPPGPWASAAPKTEPVAPADPSPGIAPPDGELPDFAAWDAAEHAEGGEEGYRDESTAGQLPDPSGEPDDRDES